MDKQKFSYIGDVSKKIEVPCHILRYWEKEFSCIKPLRDRNGNRVYREKDIANIRQIKFLIYEKGYTIRGAKKQMRQESPKQIQKTNRDFLKTILKEVQELKKCLR